MGLENTSPTAVIGVCAIVLRLLVMHSALSLSAVSRNRFNNARGSSRTRKAGQIPPIQWGCPR